jgi:hypothetical protein
LCCDVFKGDGGINTRVVEAVVLPVTCCVTCYLPPESGVCVCFIVAESEV